MEKARQSADVGKTADIPEYKDYSLIELYQVLNSIRGDLYPHVFAALETEISSRTPESVIELEDCYFALDKEKYPDRASRLFTEVERLGGFTLSKPLEVTEVNKYQTFWRRFWALFVDGFVIGIPLTLILFAIHGSEILRPAAEAYVDHVLQIGGIIYYVAMHAIYGQTVGKMATRVKVRDKSESRGITLKQSILREIVPVVFTFLSLMYFLGFGATGVEGELTDIAEKILLSLALVSLLWGILELLTMIFNKKRRALHDFIAGTVVTRVS